MTHKNKKKARIFMFLSSGCSLLRAECFFCSLGVLYVGLGIGKLQFLIQNFFFSAEIFYQFLVIKAWIRIRDPDPGSGSGIRIRNQKKWWIRIRIRILIKSMRIRNPGLLVVSCDVINFMQFLLFLYFRESLAFICSLFSNHVINVFLQITLCSRCE